MLSKKRQRKQFKKHWRALKKHLQAFYISHHPEELHQLRVRFKKMKALLFFLRSASEIKKIRSALKPVKAIYKHAGRIRNAVINLSLTTQYQPKDPAFKNRLQQDLAAETSKFVAKRERYFRDLKKAFPILSGNFKKLKNQNLLDAYKKYLTKLAQFFALERQQPEAFHAARKTIKILLYIHKILPGTVAESLKLNTGYLGRLEELLGQWHDVISVAGLLTKEGCLNAARLEEFRKENTRLRRAVKYAVTGFRKKAYN